MPKKKAKAKTAIYHPTKRECHTGRDRLARRRIFDKGRFVGPVLERRGVGEGDGGDPRDRCERITHGRQVAQCALGIFDERLRDRDAHELNVLRRRETGLHRTERVTEPANAGN